MPENWTEIPSENSLITTIPESLLQKIADLEGDRFVPSRIARVINRSIDGRHYKRYLGLSGFKRGHYIEDGEHFNTNYGNDIRFVQGENTLVYRNITQPSFYGSFAMEALDKKFKSIDFVSLSRDQIFKIAALASAVVTSAHAFPDAHGRTAVGLAAVIIKKYTGADIDLNKVEKEDDDSKLSTAFARVSISMFPRKYNPEKNLSDLVGRGGGLVVDTPTEGYNNLEEVKRFASEYAESIGRYVEGFTIKDADENNNIFYKSINDVASIYLKCVVNKE